MASIKKITYNFFQISPKKGIQITTTLKSLQQELFKLKDIEIDTFPQQMLTDKVVYMHDFQKKGSYYIGTIILSQMNNLSGKVDYQKKKVEPLALNPSEGLEKHSTFILDPQANILVYENGGVSSNIFINYLIYCGYISKSEVALLINPSELQKFYNMEIITKFSVKLAKVENGSLLSENNPENLAIDQVIDSADATNTDELEYTIKVNNKKGAEKKSLIKATIVNFVKEFIKHRDSSEIRHLRVTGEYHDDEGRNHIVPLDLLEERLHGTVEIERKNRNSTIFQIQDKYNQLELMYSKHRQSVLNTYSV